MITSATSRYSKLLRIGLTLKLISTLYNIWQYFTAYHKNCVYFCRFLPCRCMQKFSTSSYNIGKYHFTKLHRMREQPRTQPWLLMFTILAIERWPAAWRLWGYYNIQWCLLRRNIKSPVKFVLYVRYSLCVNYFGENITSTLSKIPLQIQILYNRVPLIYLSDM